MRAQRRLGIAEAWSKLDRYTPSTRERTAVVPGTTTLKGGLGRGNGTSASATVESYTGRRNPAGGERVAAAGDSDSENDRTRASGDRAGTGGASDQSSAGSAACTLM